MYLKGLRRVKFTCVRLEVYKQKQQQLTEMLHGSRNISRLNHDRICGHRFRLQYKVHTTFGRDHQVSRKRTCPVPHREHSSYQYHLETRVQIK